MRRFPERSKAVQRTALQDAAANATAPSPSGRGQGRGRKHGFYKNHLRVFTLIRPSATFSLREKESNGTRLAKRDMGEGNIQCRTRNVQIPSGPFGNAPASWSACAVRRFKTNPKSRPPPSRCPPLHTWTFLVRCSTFPPMSKRTQAVFRPYRRLFCRCFRGRCRPR